jgi:tRNA-dependent cyclodipeptide synthase
MKYKINIKDIQPEIYSLGKYLPRKCFLGISLSNPFFHGKHLSRILKWVDYNFEDCLIIIADHLHRFNEYIFTGSDSDTANRECSQMGESIHKSIEELIKQIGESKFKILHWLEFVNTPEFRINHEKINTYFNQDAKFKKSVLRSCELFIDKQLKKRYQIYVTREIAIKKSCEYILEELAVFSILIERGYFIQVYPGTQLEVLKEIANNSFPNLDSSLKKAIYIDLTIKKIR